MNACYLRPLEEKDALISYHWRNDPIIWKHTGSRPDREITQEIESNWIKSALARENEIRFAICMKQSDEYIGNVQLTSISDATAEFHIFIGEKKYWGKGLGTSATAKLLEYAQAVLQLKELYLWVSLNNVSAIRAYTKCGFENSEEKEGQLKMTKQFAQ